MWPTIASLWSHWAPSAERSLLIGFSNGGSQIGNVIALSLGSFLCGTDAGWPSIFYVFGKFKKNNLITDLNIKFTFLFRLYGACLEYIILLFNNRHTS
jgi:MFS family permease